MGVVTQPDFTWLGPAASSTSLPLPELGGSAWTGVPVLFLILLVVAVIFHVLMKYTDFGRAIYAIGGNATAARLAGINLRRIKVTHVRPVRCRRPAWPGCC